MRLVAQVGAATCHGLLSHLAGVISSTRTQPATVLSVLAMRTRPPCYLFCQCAPENSLFLLVCIVFSYGKYFGCFIYE
jgi:hypothetical protein